jgi:hypothetical protein
MCPAVLAMSVSQDKDFFLKKGKKKKKKKRRNKKSKIYTIPQIFPVRT